MNQQQQDKAAFFAQYWGQYIKTSDIHSAKGLKPIEIFAHSIQYVDAGSYLLLKPLSNITDEEAYEMLSIIRPTLDRGFNIREYADQMVAGFESERPVPGASFSDCVLAIDFLRSRGYLIPFRNYSTDQILEIGWAKLREP